MKFDCELVGKIGSMALINREINEFDYNTFEQKAIPIINYNDSVSNDEIMKMEINRIRNNNKSVIVKVETGILGLIEKMREKVVE